MNAIKTEKLTKFYGKNRGIIDVDLTVPEGDFFGFIGPNGAGKSTLIRTLLGLISKSGGSAEIFEKDISQNKIENLKRIGYLPSECFFYKDMKVKEQLAFSASARGLDCKKEASLLCERLELDPEKRIKELSFGNRKKVGIVCALQHRPDLYILDEPTSGLDPLMQKEFYDILKERNEQGATVFLSSHLLFEIARHCKHAAVIREGRLLVSDSVEKLGHTGVKKVTLRGVCCPSHLSSLTKIKDLQIENDTARFLYDGAPRDLLAALSDLRFEDFSVEDPELDEIFLHYYAKEEL
jgi:ABC-2 type transport system ATP-binding protein